MNATTVPSVPVAVHHRWKTMHRGPLVGVYHRSDGTALFVRRLFPFGPIVSASLRSFWSESCWVEGWTNHYGDPQPISRAEAKKLYADAKWGDKATWRD